MPRRAGTTASRRQSPPAHSPACGRCCGPGPRGHQTPDDISQQPLLPGQVVVAALQHRIDVFGGGDVVVRGMVVAGGRVTPNSSTAPPGPCCSRSDRTCQPSLRLRHYAGAMVEAWRAPVVSGPLHGAVQVPGLEVDHQPGPRPGRPRRRADAHPGCAAGPRHPADGGRAARARGGRARRDGSPPSCWSSRARCSGWHDRLRPRRDRHALPAAGGGAGGGAGRLRR